MPTQYFHFDFLLLVSVIAAIPFSGRMFSLRRVHHMMRSPFDARGRAQAGVPDPSWAGFLPAGHERWDLSWLHRLLGEKAQRLRAGFVDSLMRSDGDHVLRLAFG
jgi:hypothetical protein